MSQSLAAQYDAPKIRVHQALHGTGWRADGYPKRLPVQSNLGSNEICIHQEPEMKKNEDGSLTLYIQKDSPGADKESNWLPAPSDPIYMVMRLYWPKTEAPSILPPGEGAWEPPGIVKAN